MTTIIAFVSWKGGTGKTLLAVNTAERAINNGIDAVLCDFDPQSTALRHCAIRQARHPDAPQLPAVRGTISTEGQRALTDLAASQRHQLLICDLPGADSYVMDLLLETAHHILIPLRGAPYELMVTASLIEQGRQRQWPMILVPNNLPHYASRAQSLVSSIEKLGVPVAPARIVQRVHYWDAIDEGLGVCELRPDSKAAAEMDDYWNWVKAELIEPASNTQGALSHA